MKPKVKQRRKPTVTTIQLPPIVGELTLPDMMPLGELADALKQNTAKVVASFRQFGMVVDLHTMVPFEFVANVIRLYGFTAKKAA